MSSEVRNQQTLLSYNWRYLTFIRPIHSQSLVKKGELEGHLSLSLSLSHTHTHTHTYTHIHTQCLYLCSLSLCVSHTHIHTPTHTHSTSISACLSPSFPVSLSLSLSLSHLFFLHFLFTMHISLRFPSWCINNFHGLSLCLLFFFNHPISFIFPLNVWFNWLETVNVVRYSLIWIDVLNEFYNPFYFFNCQFFRWSPVSFL